MQAVVAVAGELEAENYYDIERINERYAFFYLITSDDSTKDGNCVLQAQIDWDFRL